MQRTAAFATPTGIPTRSGSDERHPSATHDETSAASMELLRGSFSIRNLRTSDAQACEHFFGHLDPQDVRMRFAGRRGYSTDLFLPETDRAFDSAAFAAVDPTDAVLGILNLVSLGRDTAEAAVIVRSDRKRRGIGRSLLEHVIQRSPSTGITQFIGYVLAENKPMLALAQSIGFIRLRREGFFIIVRRSLTLATALASADASQLTMDGHVRDQAAKDAR